MLAREGCQRPLQLLLKAFDVALRPKGQASDIVAKVQPQAALYQAEGLLPDEDGHLELKEVKLFV